MAERVVALVPAAGSGDRLGRGPKAFVEVAGRALLAWAVSALQPWVDEVVVAVPLAEVVRARDLLAATLAGAPAGAPTGAPAGTPAGAATRVIVGGATRQASVARLLDGLQADVVVVHDAARPFLDAATLRAAVAAAREQGACSVVQPVADSLVRRDDGATVDRDALWAVQTPQAFRRDLLAAAHEAALRDGVHAHDDAGLVRRLGAPVAWVPGGAHLFKVTTPADLELAEAVARGGAFGIRPPGAARP